jgi:hypothetical protein
MVLKLYGYPISTVLLRVAVVLKEKNVPFEFYMVDIVKGEHKAPSFLACLHQSRRMIICIRVRLRTENYHVCVLCRGADVSDLGRCPQAVRGTRTMIALRHSSEYDILLANQKYLAGDVPIPVRS